jgi:hypothetical protein
VAASDFFRRLVADAPGTSSLVRKGRQEAFRHLGTNSIMAGVPLWVAKKVVGTGAARRAGWGAAGRTARAAREGAFEDKLYQNYHRPLKNLDEKAGKWLANKGVGKNLFRHVDELPTSRTIGGNKALIKHETHSLTAPIAKGVAVASPLLAAAKIGDLMSHKDDHKELMKEAADKLASYQLRDQAIKIAFDLVELKRCKPFSSYDEFEEKVASIVERGPALVAEALSMQPLEQELGTLTVEKTASVGDAAEEFFHRLQS